MKKIFLIFIVFALSVNVSGDDYVPLDYIWTFAYSRNGNYIATADIGGNINIYNSSTLNIIKTLQGSEAFNFYRQIEFSPDGLYIASCSHDIIIHELETGNIIFHSTPQSYVTTSISYRFDGNRLVSGSAIGSIIIWDTINGIEIMKLDGTPREVITTISYSPDGNRIIATFENCIKIWDANSGMELITINEQNMWSVSASFNTDGTRIIANYSNKINENGRNKIINIYDSYNYKILYSYIIGDRPIRNVFFIPNSNYIIYLYADYLLVVMDYINGNIISEFRQSNGFVLSMYPIAIEYNGENIVYTENGNNIKIWKIY